ncbi:MAG: ATP-binding protein [Chromatiaceae bacterium]
MHLDVAECPPVMGDRDLLFQAVTNLLDNAIKYTPDGGEIRLGLTCAGTSIELTVSDNGPGIPAAERDKVLQRFYRLEHSRSSPGSGLGLSLVAAVAQRHRAALQLDDNVPGLRAKLQFASRD